MIAYMALFILVINYSPTPIFYIQMSTDPYDRPITAHGQRSSMSLDPSQQRSAAGYFNTSYGGKDQNPNPIFALVIRKLNV